jgi:hypothetical protein
VDPAPDPTTHFFPDLDLPKLQNDPVRLPPFHFDADPDPAFHSNADPDPTFQFNVDPAPDPTTHFFQIWILQSSKLNPLRLSPFHFDADQDPAFHFDADPDQAFLFDEDSDPASQNDAEPCGFAT